MREVIEGKVPKSLHNRMFPFESANPLGLWPTAAFEQDDERFEAGCATARLLPLSLRSVRGDHRTWEGTELKASKSSRMGAIAMAIAAIIAATLAHPRSASALAENNVNGTYAFTLQAVLTDPTKLCNGSTGCGGRNNIVGSISQFYVQLARICPPANAAVPARRSKRWPRKSEHPLRRRAAAFSPPAPWSPTASAGSRTDR